LKKATTNYNDKWKQLLIKTLSAVDYFRNLPHNIKEELHYKLIVENFENGAKVFVEGNECREITFVTSGALELYIEDGNTTHTLEVLNLGSCVGAYSVLNGGKF
jgi:signal-transduction protein with cAMP-binding, CBS, and nucleotidyltransferase domain